MQTSCIVTLDANQPTGLQLSLFVQQKLLIFVKGAFREMYISLHLLIFVEHLGYGNSLLQWKYLSKTHWEYVFKVSMNYTDRWSWKDSSFSAQMNFWQNLPDLANESKNKVLKNKRNLKTTRNSNFKISPFSFLCFRTFEG